MNCRIAELRKYVVEKQHHHLRQEVREDVLVAFTNSLKEKNLSDTVRAKQRLTWVMEHEEPVILQDEKIVFTRTVQKIPDIFTPEEWCDIRSKHYIHELGRVCNINSNYSYTIEVGLKQRREEVVASLNKQKQLANRQGIEFLEAVIQSIDDLENLVNRYALEALRQGREDLFDLLRKVPAQGAETFYEALQFFRILHFTLWAGGNYHNTVGRLDQYMLRYLEKDMETGLLDYDSALELLEEFFLTFNKDSDLYPGMQQGDNGQSLVLGGVDAKGLDADNLLTELCLKASLELRLIDPKINLRVTENTDIEKYDRGTELTRQGMGFPQYSNDEVVIQGLVSKGYDLADARDYVVAACWEYIIPGYGMDIPNIGALSLTKVIENTLKKYLRESKSFIDFMGKIKSEIQAELISIYESITDLYIEPAPFQSLLMNGRIEEAKDISLGARYNNYGIHGTGIATAVDSLAAVKKFVFEEKSIKPATLLMALEDNFSDQESLWNKLKHEAPKFGNDDDFVDDIAITLLNIFSELTAGVSNERGGCFRPGSGSAMYYLWHIKDVGATPDGRRQGEPLSANFSPGLNVKLNGPVSIIKSFSKPDMTRIINGGPLTLELHDTVFRNVSSIRKVSSLIKSYLDMGGQQLQINAVNREQLIEAQKHPELHKNLIVRVWGWSGYFVELDEEYQNHIIQRVELQL
jgi:formate C-acetyltransferase